MIDTRSPFRVPHSRFTCFVLVHRHTLAAQFRFTVCSGCTASCHPLPRLSHSFFYLPAAYISLSPLLHVPKICKFFPPRLSFPPGFMLLTCVTASIVSSSLLRAHAHGNPLSPFPPHHPPANFTEAFLDY